MIFRPIGGSRIFLGGLKDEFIQMCTDCIAVKTQLLRWHFLTNTVDDHTHLAKLHTHHYPGLLGRLRCKSGLQNNSEIIPKVWLLATQTQVHDEKTRRSGIEVTQNYTNKPGMPAVTFVGSLCKIHALLFSKIADVHDVRT